MKLRNSDPEVYRIIKQEETRQQNKLSMIPSENFFSPAVREAAGSVFMHKYSEGNVGARYYEGNEWVDELEKLVFERAKKVFKLPPDWEVNVQALSGSNANLAVYLALLKPGETMMGMYLPDGGHLSHGWSYEPGGGATDSLIYEGGSRKVNITSRLYKTIQYKTDRKTRQLNYKVIEEAARKYRPRLIITGGTAYPRLINHQRMRKIADKVGAYYLADIAHEAGLIAAGVIPSPVGIADVVTLTAHKTLRAGRGAIILAPAELMKKINRGVLPGLQGGPHNHNIAAIAVGLGEALKPAFRVYQRQIVKNAQALSAELTEQGFSLVTGGTDKHLILLDLTDQTVTGRQLAKALNAAGIVTNFNTIPQERRPPRDPSGLRLGTPWITTRGMKVREMKIIAGWFAEVMDIAGEWSGAEGDEFEILVTNSPELRRIAREVAGLCAKFPLEIKKAAVDRLAAMGVIMGL